MSLNFETVENLNHTAGQPPAAEKPLLDRFLPDWRLRQVDQVSVTAPPEPAWAVAREIDLYRFPFVRVLFNLRTLPERLFGQGPPPPQQLPLDGIFNRAGTGFRLLAERPREIAVGTIGQVWKSSIPFKIVEPERWIQFQEPGFCKVAWSLGVDSQAGGGSLIRVEVRVGATDDESWKKFKWYWSLVGPFSHWIRRTALGWAKKELGAANGDGCGRGKDP